ncbi:MAG: flagellar filament capping protein FliD [Burkholderiaceae bacterium]|nr:flagellar filament capping protein FliD [Burkholderiaceae bacterium]
MTTTTASGGLKYDPTSTATSLATAYVSGQQDLLTTQTKQNKTTTAALGSLKSALLAFQASLSALGGSKTMLSNAASFSSSGYGSASATSAAAPGTYSFFVDSVAQASQDSYDISPGLGLGGSLIVNVGQNPIPIVIDLSGADADSSGSLDAKELAAAINTAPNNGGVARASVVTINGATQLVVSATQTGLENAISLDGSLLANPVALGAPNNLVAAKDAVVYLGGINGVKIEQASNTFAVIDDVSMTFTKAQAPGDAALTLTVGTDSAATTANVQAFVDAYNKLKTVLDSMTSVGDPQNGVAAGPFANDGALNVLRNRLLDTIRTAVPGAGATLANYGITAARNGQLTLNTSRLQSTLALNPAGLDTLIGSSGTAASVAGLLHKAVDTWSNSANGQLSKRQLTASKLSTSLETRQAKLDNQFNSAYKRYLVQFTELQKLQTQMDSTSSMFTALFSGDK